MARPFTRNQVEDDGKRYALGLRVTGERRRQLELAAENSARSLSSEVELRLERSFWDDSAMGGPEMHAVFRMMAAAAILVQSRVPPNRSNTWLNDPEIFQAVRQSWIAIIDGLDPGNSKQRRKLTEAQHAPTIHELGLVDIIRQGMEYLPRPAPKRRVGNKKQKGDG